MTNRIEKAEAFLREKLSESSYFIKYPEKRGYRAEHSIRVARIAGEIAAAENMDEEAAVLAGLLHDVSYCREFADHDDWKDHGRSAARIARPFLETLELPTDTVDEICYGIAIHVDGKSDFERKRTPLALTVTDADNIDRFDAYRLYETLEYVGYSKFSPEEKRAYAGAVIGKMADYLQMELATPTATDLWRQRITYYQDFFQRLLSQIDAGTGYLDPQRRSAESPVDPERMMQLSGHF